MYDHHLTVRVPRTLRDSLRRPTIAASAIIAAVWAGLWGFIVSSAGKLTSTELFDLDLLVIAIGTVLTVVVLYFAWWVITHGGGAAVVAMPPPE